MKRLFALLLVLLVLPAVSFAQQTAVGLYPVTAGGTKIFRSLSVTATKAEVSATPAQIYGWSIRNSGAAAVFLKIYNAPAASVTVGTTTPVMTIPISIASARDVAWPQGIEFTSGITIACVTGVADNDTTAAGANECVVNILYR